jgi:hypothetical protein
MTKGSEFRFSGNKREKWRVCSGVAALTMTEANGVRLFTVWNGAGNKHEVPRSYSAAEESAASWTERRDDEGWKIGEAYSSLRSK